MKVNCINKKTYQLMDNGQCEGQLTYIKSFSRKAQITLKNQECYQIKPLGFLKKGISITCNDKEIATLHANWKGQIIINYPDKGKYVFKTKGLFNKSYTIENSKRKTVLQCKPRTKWGKLQCDYDISYCSMAEQSFILTGIYAANYYRIMVARKARSASS